MRNRNIIAALLMLLAGMQTSNAQKMVVKLTDNQTIKYNVSQVECVTFEEAGEHEYVDLGLPSGTLWATCNVGANSPEEYGDYFAWGETEPKGEYNWSTYRYSKGSMKTITKYCASSDYGYNGFTDGLTELLPEDDAATANWGSDWQMPSYDQCVELYNTDNTTTEWTKMNGVNGRKITSKNKNNGNWIFIPAGGYFNNSKLNNAGTYADYWSRSLNTDDSSYAFYFYFNSSVFGMNGGQGFYRSNGRTVRPVRKQ